MVTLKKKKKERNGSKLCVHSRKCAPWASQSLHSPSHSKAATPLPPCGAYVRHTREARNDETYILLYRIRNVSAVTQPQDARTSLLFS